MTPRTLPLLKKTFLSWIGKLFSDVHSAIVSIVVGILLVGGGGSYLTSGNLRNAINETMQSPTPLWLSIVLALVLAGYVHLKYKKTHSCAPPKGRVAFFTTGQFKWKVTIYNDWFEVDKYPFCSKHDVQFIFAHNKKYCPGVIGEKCNNHLSDSDSFRAYESVKSMVESKIRNGESLC